MGLSEFVVRKINELLPDTDPKLISAYINCLSFLKRLNIVDSGDCLCLTEQLVQKVGLNRKTYFVVMDPWTPDVAVTMTGFADGFIKIKSCEVTDGSELPRAVSLGLRLEAFVNHE